MVGDGFGGRLWYKPYNYSAGCYSAFAVCTDDNQLYSWGHNLHGELGIGSTIATTTPHKVDGMSDVFYYSVGYMSGAIKGDLSAWVWGLPYDSVPFKLMDDVRFISSGENSITLVKLDGTVWHLGNNRTGQFGNGDHDGDSAVASVQKMDSITTAVRAANGFYSTAILLENGDVYAAGRNYHGGLGLPSSVIDSKYPIKVQGLKDIIDIKATAFGFAALDKHGDVYGWGMWVTNNKVYVPQKLPGLSNIVSLSGRNDGWHFMAVDKDKNCYAWGRNQYAQLGTGDASSYKFDPVLVATGVLEALAGETFSYLIKDDGKMYCTGQSKEGSIWMNLPNVTRFAFTEIRSEEPPMNLCEKRTHANVILDTSICEGLSITIGDETYTEPGRHYYRVKHDDGDTLLVINIMPGSHRTFPDEVHLCDGESHTVGSNVYTNAGSYTDTLVSISGCDSIIVTNITVGGSTSYFQSDTICESQIYSVGQFYYSQTGTYVDTLVNNQGCDSVVTTELLVVETLVTNNRYDICYGESVDINSITYSSSTEIIDSFSNIYGCDSIIVHTVDVHNEVVQEENYYFCPGKSVDVDGAVYSTIGTFIDSFYTSWGCDSVVILHIDTFPDFTCYESSYFAPNAFTPDGDNLNGTFKIRGVALREAQLRVYNRWGEKLYDGEALKEGWDGNYLGKECQQGAYFYIAKVVTGSNRLVMLKGTITLLR